MGRTDRLGRPLHHQLLKLGEKAPLTRGLPMRVDGARAGSAQDPPVSHSSAGWGVGGRGTPEHRRTSLTTYCVRMLDPAGPHVSTPAGCAARADSYVRPRSPRGALRPSSKCSDSERLSID